jgi:hypothetical protein
VGNKLETLGGQSSRALENLGGQSL